MTQTIVHEVFEAADWLPGRLVETTGQQVNGEAWLQAVRGETRPTDTRLVILAVWSGGGSYNHTEVTESESDVRVRVVVRHRVGIKPGTPHVRTMELRTGVIEVRLGAPLGHRTLVGASQEAGRFIDGTWWVRAADPTIDVVICPGVQR